MTLSKYAFLNPSMFNRPAPAPRVNLRATLRPSQPASTGFHLGGLYGMVSRPLMQGLLAAGGGRLAAMAGNAVGLPAIMLLGSHLMGTDATRQIFGSNSLPSRIMHGTPYRYNPVRAAGNVMANTFYNPIAQMHTRYQDLWNRNVAPNLGSLSMLNPAASSGIRTLGAAGSTLLGAASSAWQAGSGAMRALGSLAGYGR